LQIAFGAPLDCDNVSWPGSEQHQRLLVIGKRAGHTCSSPDLLDFPRLPLQRVAGPQGALLYYSGRLSYINAPALGIESRGTFICH
jgi:hypothetical protein